MIKKEIHDNLLNIRFAGACMISILLIISSIVVLSKNYERDYGDYRSRVETQDNFINSYGHMNRSSWMSRTMREPSPYRPLVLGIDREAAQENFVSNPVPVLFSCLDFAMIVTIIMSLMAILFAYNAVTGEREDGLLKLMLSTTLSRGTLIFGKFIGGTISLLLPFTIGVLGGLLWMALNPGLQFQGMDFRIFLLLLLASFLYISTFYAVALLCSARSHTSNEAVLKSLFAWVLFVLVLPNISPSLATQVYSIPSATQVDQEVFRITAQERDEIIGQRGRDLLQSRFPDLSRIPEMNQQEIQRKVRDDGAFRERYALYSKSWDEMVTRVNIEQQKQAKKILTEFAARSKYQEKLATIFSSLSPFSNFVFMATDLTETGIEADDRWEKLGSLYERELKSYVDARYQTERENNPAFTSNDYLDLRARPRFRYQPAGVTERIGMVLPQIGLLAGFNLVFLALAVFSFLKYDVR